MAMGSREVLKLLRRYESRNVTFVDADGSWPIVWTRARGAHVWDAEGRKYVDLTAGFGVAAAGHGNRRVTRAAQAQMKRLVHAMGDVHPHAGKAQLARELSRITFERWSEKKNGKSLFCNSGFEAVEAAVKTALLRNGKKGVIAFEGGYHGLGYGALTTTHRDLFRSPFQRQLADFVDFVPFPETEQAVPKLERQIDERCAAVAVGAILVEPVQGRGGIRVPPISFLPMLRRVCDAQGALLIADEVFTGFGRTGRWFACEHSDTVPDLICLGKALTGGFPLSACVGKAEVMDAWPRSAGEALHTSTFLGHPVGCAMALANIQEIWARNLAERSTRLGERLLKELLRIPAPKGLELSARGMGLMVGLEVRDAQRQPATEIVFEVAKAMLREGFICLPEGEHGNVISFTPPLTIQESELMKAARALGRVLQERPQG